MAREEHAASYLAERRRGKLGEQQQIWQEMRGACLSLVWTQRNLQMRVVFKN
jgi:hypothetical protein